MSNFQHVFAGSKSKLSACCTSIPLCHQQLPEVHHAGILYTTNTFIQKYQSFLPTVYNFAEI
jgi:hypothetical protein